MADRIIKVEKNVIKEFHTAEAMKTIRTNLLFCGAAVKAIGITSVGPGEGKSSVAFQIAASMAEAGKNVLLVDADLRKSVLVKRLGIHFKVHGLTHCFSGMAKINEILYPTDMPRLFIMFPGIRIANPSEILGSKAFENLMAVLKKHFDYVIVDTPPLGQVIDCAAMAPALDGVIMVIDSTNNSYKLERKVKEQLNKAGAHILGVVLNKVDLKEQGEYYGKAYGKYGYGYEYGYGEKKGEARDAIDISNLGE